MIERKCLIGGRAIDAIHTQLALAMGRDARGNSRSVSAHALIYPYDAAALAKDVQEQLAASPGEDEIWLAALYAFRLARNKVYLTTNVATALVTLLIVLSRAGYRLLADDAQVFAAMHAVMSKEFGHEELVKWLRPLCVRQKGKRQ